MWRSSEKYLDAVVEVGDMEKGNGVLKLWALWQGKRRGGTAERANASRRDGEPCTTSTLQEGMTRKERNKRQVMGGSEICRCRIWSIWVNQRWSSRKRMVSKEELSSLKTGFKSIKAVGKEVSLWVQWKYYKKSFLKMWFWHAVSNCAQTSSQISDPYSWV